MAKTCINHREAPATVHCFQCHKPLCQQCVMVQPHGSFCSSTCSLTYKEMKAQLAGQKKKGGVGGFLVKLILIVVIVLGGIHAARRFGGVTALEGIDLVGKVLPVK